MAEAKNVLALLLAALLSAPGALAAGSGPPELPPYDVADPDAARVSAQTLLANEIFWPYHVRLTRSLPLGAAGGPLAEGLTGVLVRVSPEGLARIDFGRDGRREVPVDATDLVARANRIRVGEDEKLAPNFLLAIGLRLADASTSPLRSYPMTAASGHPGFLCVFADPGAEGFAALAEALAPLAGRHGVLTILLPEGRMSDRQVGERLRAADWPVAFVSDRFAESYRRSLLAESAPLPALQLQTPEGRVLFEGRGVEAVRGLVVALDRSLGPGVARTDPEGTR